MPNWTAWSTELGPKKTQQLFHCQWPPLTIPQTNNTDTSTGNPIGQQPSYSEVLRMANPQIKQQPPVTPNAATMVSPS